MDINNYRAKVYKSALNAKEDSPKAMATKPPKPTGAAMIASTGSKPKAARGLIAHKANSILKSTINPPAKPSQVTKEVAQGAASSLPSSTQAQGSKALSPISSADGTKDLNLHKESLYRRVAKFLVLIGTDEASKILPHLTGEQTERIIPEIATIRHIDKDEATTIFAEFAALLEKSKEDGGVETARTILEKAFGKDKAEAMIQKSIAFPEGKPFEYFKEVGPERILTLLNDESASTKALVLSQLEPPKAAAVIQAMTASDKKEVVLRLSKLGTIMPEVLKQVDKAMQEKLKRVNIEDSENIDGRGALANILRAMNPQHEEELLVGIARDNPDLGQELRKRLFTQADIMAGDDKYIQKLLHSMEDHQIVLLIAGKKEDFRQKLLTNLSTNRQKDILELEDIEKPFKKLDCERETSIFYSKLRHAYEDGEFIIRGRAGEEYVD